MTFFDWNDIRFFLAVARQASLSAAARALRVDHTTVARRIAALEAHLGLPLFHRLPRGWKPTVEGEALRARAERLEAEALGIERAALDVGPLTGPIRLTAPPLLADRILLPALLAFQRDNPGITLDLNTNSFSLNLSQGAADLAVRVGWPRESGLIARKLCDIAYGLYARTDCLGPAALPVLGLDDTWLGTGQRTWLDTRRPDTPPPLVASDVSTLLAAARLGWGSVLLPCFVADDAPELSLVPGEAPPDRPLCLILHADIRRAPRIRALADHLITTITAAAPLLARRPQRKTAPEAGGRSSSIERPRELPPGEA